MGVDASEKHAWKTSSPAGLSDRHQPQPMRAGGASVARQQKPGVTNFFGIVKIAELASQGFWPFDRTAIVIRSRIAAL